MGSFQANGSRELESDLHKFGHHHVLRIDAQPDPLNDKLRALCELEFSQMKGACMHDIPSESIKFRTGRYEVSLPWKQFRPPLPDNYTRATGGLMGFWSIHVRTPRSYETMTTSWADWKGYCWRCPRNGSWSIMPLLFAAPHGRPCRQRHHQATYSIWHFRKNGKSLFERLSTHWAKKILDILMRFSSYRIALMADIERPSLWFQ